MGWVLNQHPPHFVRDGRPILFERGDAVLFEGEAASRQIRYAHLATTRGKRPMRHLT